MSHKIINKKFLIIVCNEVLYDLNGELERTTYDNAQLISYYKSQVCLTYQE